MLVTDLWEKCYDDSWKNEITPEAFSHPAKFSRGLIRRIYAHMEAEGWLPENGIILDPFGGVALGGLDACLHGLTWVGIELEPRFCVLAEQNIALWNKRYSGKMPRWGSATILNGDSRNLAAILQGQAEGAVSSPPFAEVIGHDGGKEHMPKIGNFGLEYGHSDGQLGAMKFTEAGLAGAVSSPPYAETVMGANSKSIDRQKQWETYRASGGGQSFDAFCHTQDLHSQDYGHSSGQLGAMKATPAGLADAMVSSPPYAETPIAGYDGSMGDQWRETGKTPRQRSGGKLLNEQYGGTSPGQLGAMRATESGLDAAVSSPPFENGQPLANPANTYKVFEHIGSVQLGQDGYGKTDGNIGNSTGSDFWAASRTIVDQLYRVLAPGAHCVWVLKAFVKAGKIVPFPEQWQAMCEAAGFETVHVHHAMLVKTKGTQIDMDGNSHTKTIARKSFFRRLAESKGSPRIDYEIILCMVKL